jgi:uncharacterized protein with FMN-binding domain
MDRNESGAYWALLALTIAFSLLAIVTMIPNPAASKPNVLGYRSVCSFAPAASALCGVLAGITCTIRNRKVSRRASATRYQPPFLPIAVGILLLTLAAVFGIRFGIAQSRFDKVITLTAQAGQAARAPGALAGLADGTRSATITEGEVSATVEVSVKAGIVDTLRLIKGKNMETALAEEIFARVRKAGSVEVDAVSGATASSNVLLKAIAAAASP